MSMRLLLIFTGMPGWAEIAVVAFVGLLLFGRRLPEVGRSLGRTIVEFKRGIKEVESEVNVASRPGKENKHVLPPAQEQASPQLESSKPEPEEPAQKPEVSSGD